MPKLTPFQHKLLQRERDQARIEHNREVEQAIFKLAKESERNRKQLIALKQASVATLKQVIYNKQTLRKRGTSPAPIKFDCISDSDSESPSETDSQSSEISSQETTESRFRSCDYFEFILGITTGLLISLCVAFANAEKHTQLNAPL
jgi:hypothetical protein